MCRRLERRRYRLPSPPRRKAIEGLLSVNVHDVRFGGYLQDFKQNAGFTRYIEIGNADANSLAKLADFVSLLIVAMPAAIN